MTSLTEADVEQVALDLLSGLGWGVARFSGIFQAPSYSGGQRVGCISHIEDNALCISCHCT